MRKNIFAVSLVVVLLTGTQAFSATKQIQKKNCGELVDAEQTFIDDLCQSIENKTKDMTELCSESFISYTKKIYDAPYKYTGDIEKRSIKKTNERAIDERVSFNTVCTDEGLKIQSLQLNAQNITEIPASIENLTNLEDLDVTNNHLSSLPATIANLKNMKRLSLGTNDFANFPNVIGSLTNLDWLDLFQNELVEIPSNEIVKLTNLTFLDVSWNRLKRIPSEIGLLTNLQILHVGTNTGDHMNPDSKARVFLPTMIGNLVKLNELDISNLGLEADDMPTSIGNLTNLEVLDISKNVFAELPVALASLTKIRELRIHDNHFLNSFPGVITNMKNATVYVDKGQFQMFRTKALALRLKLQTI